MALCEMCGGREAAIKASIEGTELNVCGQCVRYGKVISEIAKAQRKVPKKFIKEPEPEIVQVVVPDYAKLIRDAREKTGLTQKDFAKRINEKESLIHNIETGKFEPSIKIAEKMERFLKIKLIEKYEEKPEKVQKREIGNFTIGDLIKVKKRQ